MRSLAPRSVLSEIRQLLSLLSDHAASFGLLIFLGFAASVVDAVTVSLIVILLYRAVLGSAMPAMAGSLSLLYRWTDTLTGHMLWRLCLAIGLLALFRQLFVSSYEIVGSWV